MRYYIIDICHRKYCLLQILDIEGLEAINNAIILYITNAA